MISHRGPSSNCCAAVAMPAPSAASRNVRPVAALLAVVTGCPLARFGSLRHATPGSAALAAEPRAQGHGGPGAPASGPLARAGSRRGGGLQAHAPSLGQRAPVHASACQALPLPLLPRRSWLSSLRQPP